MPATLRFFEWLVEWRNVGNCTNSPDLTQFCKVVPRRRLVASPTKAFAKTCPLNNNFPLTSLIISGTILLIYPHSEQTGAFCPESGHIRDSGFPRDSQFICCSGVFFYP